MQNLLPIRTLLKRKSKLPVFCVYFLLLAFALVAPSFLGMYYTGLLVLILIYTILSTGFNIAYGFLGMMTFSLGAIFGISAYTCALLISKVGLPIPVAMLAGIIAAGLSSFIISLAAYKVSGTYLTLVSYGLLEIFQRIVIEAYDLTGGTSGIHIPKWSLFGNVLSRDQMYYIIFAVLVIVLLIQRNLKKSQIGRDFISVKDNQVAASSVGICPPRTRVVGFLISSLIIGVAGVLYVNYTTFISPETFSFNTSVLILLMVLAGGKGTLMGPIIGTVIIYLVPMALNSYPDFKQLFYGLMLIALIQLFPKGICGLILAKFKKLNSSRIAENISVDDTVDFSKYCVESNNQNNIMEIKGLTKKFGGLAACNNLDIDIKQGTIHALIGPNGAGKTTFINNITGVELPTSGAVYYNGELITGKKTWEIAKKGIARTYQHVRLMPTLSVLDNVVLGARLNSSYNVFDAIFVTKKKRTVDYENYKDALECLNLIGLSDKINDSPDSLSSGQQKLLELCRALVVKPKLMILDEPCAGLTESETEQFGIIMKTIKKTGISILLVEHHMNLIMEVSDYITVIDHGTKIAEGLPKEIIENPAVRMSYLGE